MTTSVELAHVCGPIQIRTHHEHMSPYVWVRFKRYGVEIQTPASADMARFAHAVLDEPVMLMSAHDQFVAAQEYDEVYPALVNALTDVARASIKEVAIKRRLRKEFEADLRWQRLLSALNTIPDMIDVLTEQWCDDAKREIDRAAWQARHDIIGGDMSFLRHNMLGKTIMAPNKMYARFGRTSRQWMAA